MVSQCAKKSGGSKSYIKVLRWMVPVSGRGKSGDDRALHARDLSARFKMQKKQNKYGGTKIITYKVVFFLSVRDWIKTKVVLWASVVKQFSMR